MLLILFPFLGAMVKSAWRFCAARDENWFFSSFAAALAIHYLPFMLPSLTHHLVGRRWPGLSFSEQDLEEFLAFWSWENYRAYYRPLLDLAAVLLVIVLLAKVVIDSFL